MVRYALVAQLDRATGFYPVGYVFESHREYNYPTIQYYDAQRYNTMIIKFLTHIILFGFLTPDVFV